MLKKVLALFVSIVVLLTNIPVTAYAEEAVEVTAPSALLMDYETGKVLYEKNSHEVRACASITKIMTLCLIFEAIDAGKINYDTIVTASPAAAAMGGSDIWLNKSDSCSFCKRCCCCHGRVYKRK